jgi:hypothetical protein
MMGELTSRMMRGFASGAAASARRVDAAVVREAGARMAADSLELSSKELGGKAYADFRLAPTLPAADGPRTATKLSYLMTDDGSFGRQSVSAESKIEMLDDKASPNVHNVVMFDGHQNGDTQLFYIGAGDGDGKKLSAPTSVTAPGVKELQSNNPRVLAQTVAHTFDRYPANHRYMEIYSHGGGPFGVGADEIQTDLAGQLIADGGKISYMPLPDFAAGLREGLNGRSLDLLYFRACLMGNVEALNEVRGLTRYAVASENVSQTVTNSNVTMSQLFDELAGKGEEPENIARKLAQAAHADTGKMPAPNAITPSGYNTIAAFDVDKVGEVTAAVADLKGALLKAMPTQADAIVKAYDAVPLVDPSRGTSSASHQRDLIAFTDALKANVSDPLVQQAADRAATAARACMLFQADAFGDAAHGLSIWLPRFEEFAPDSRTAQQSKAYQAELMKFADSGYAQTAFAKETGWNEFLTAVRSAKESLASGSKT